MRPANRSCIRRFRLALLTIVATGLLPGGRAEAVPSRSWVNAAGGSATTTTNWSPNGLPLSGDVIGFTLNAAYTVNWGGASDTLFGMEATSGRSRLNVATKIGMRANAFFDAESVTVLTGRLVPSKLYVGWSVPTSLLLSGVTTQIETADSTSGMQLGSGPLSRVRIQGGASLRSRGWIDMAIGSQPCSLTVIGFSGFPSQSSSLRTLSSSGSAARGDLNVGVFAPGVLQIQNGALADIAGDLFVGKTSGSSGFVHLFNTPTGLMSPSLTVRGETSLGVQDHLSGVGYGVLTVERGSANLIGPSTVWNGNILVRNGAGLIAGDMTLFPGPFSSAGLSIAGTGTIATITSGLRIDGEYSGLSNAQISVDTSATLNYTGSAPISIGPSGNLFVTGNGTLQSTQPIDCRGQLYLFTGNVMAPKVHMVNPNGINLSDMDVGNTTVRARIEMDAGTFMHLQSGTVTVGDSTARDGFVSRGNCSIGAQTLVVLDKDGADLGTMSLSGGTLTLPQGGRVQTGEAVLGAGRIEGTLTVLGSLIATGTLQIADRVNQWGGTTTGPGSLQVLSGARLSAYGSIEPDLLLSGSLDLGPEPAQLSLGHGLNASAATAMRFRLSSRASGVQDKLVVAGIATLGGVLELRTWGVQPVIGDTLTIVSANAVSTPFSSVTFNGLPATGLAKVVYGPKTVKVVILGTTTVGVEPSPGAGAEARLAFVRGAGEATLRLELPVSASVKLALFDVLGREVAMLGRGAFAAGVHEIALPGRALASGMYFARASITSETAQRGLTTRVVLTH